MTHTTCPRCRAQLAYDVRSRWEGCRDHEDIYCPCCEYIVDSVFTDQIPNVRVIVAGDSSNSALKGDE